MSPIRVKRRPRCGGQPTSTVRSGRSGALGSASRRAVSPPALTPDQRLLLEQILRRAHQWRRWIGKETLDPKVLAAIARLPREDFLPPALRRQAYVDESFDIAAGQRISQPTVVAVMTDALALRPTDRVLEIGTGSGYQTAVLAQLARQVFSVEIIPELAQSARKLFAYLGLDNLSVRCADGREGWIEESPFDAIIVTCAVTEVPPALLDQLMPGRRLVAPIGRTGHPALDDAARQHVTLHRKDKTGAIETVRGLPVTFVPMSGAKVN
ncbi:MAG: protein-L-isoaspartate(D-aspartate) O-methyltransferase [Alphaproteobacteria bacterium]|nr:protein-L-isoaspartate(D-aspartate) O-methyltransferase [Alphaproteobacteria bacterium]